MGILPMMLQLVAALELDDSSHKRLDRQERDSFVAQVFACAKLPLIRVPAQRAYTLDAVRSLVEPQLSKEEQSDPRTEDDPDDLAKVLGRGIVRVEFSKK